ncbi:hypothetical protein NKJ26_29370 [Mesorhizobium sp. M0152]|uniref:hypothetical protein n=1 Tax=Mesorhizobium sp. M0152 TaxID=2956898 RepID=UPI003339AB00
MFVTVAAMAPYIAQFVMQHIDGDTIEIHGQRIRFNGIDAPEAAQQCDDVAEGARPAANKALGITGRRLVAQSSYSCEPRRTCKQIGSCEEVKWYLSDWNHGPIRRPYMSALVQMPLVGRSPGDWLVVSDARRKSSQAASCFSFLVVPEARQTEGGLPDG